jgi:hypothetical protein
MYGPSIKGQIFTGLTWQKLQEAKSALDNVIDLIDTGEPYSEDFPKLLGQLVSRFITSPGSNNEKEKEFWNQSNYSSHNHISQIPLFVWASEDDSIVDFDINTGRLLKLKSNNNISNDNLGIVKVPMGEHCGFATAYGYPTVASVIKSFILNNSPEFLKIQKQDVIPIHSTQPRLQTGERIISYWWSQGSKSADSLALSMEIYGADDSLCPEYLMFEGTANCIRETKIEFDKHFFDSHGLIVPTNPIEKEALIRELNAKVSVKFKDHTIVGTKNWPDQLLIKL